MARRPAPSARLVRRSGREARTGSRRRDDRSRWLAAPLERFNTSPPTTATTGQIEAMPLYAGTGVDAVHGRDARGRDRRRAHRRAGHLVTERIVITGANRGLGLELTRQHTARGDEVWAGLPATRRGERAARAHAARAAGRHGSRGFDRGIRRGARARADRRPLQQRRHRRPRTRRRRRRTRRAADQRRRLPRGDARERGRADAADPGRGRSPRCIGATRES